VQISVVVGSELLVISMNLCMLCGIDNFVIPLYSNAQEAGPNELTSRHVHLRSARKSSRIPVVKRIEEIIMSMQHANDVQYSTL
jgi:hypothetical protein